MLDVDIIRQINNTLNAVKNDLISVDSLKSFKLYKFLMIVKTELKSFSLKRIIRLCLNVLRYVRGERGILKEYNFDPLYHAMNGVNKSILGLNGFTGFDNSILEATKGSSPVLRRGRTPKVNNGKKRVAYFTNQLLDWFDQRPRYGGGEKYCINLADLMRENGLEVDIYQIAPRVFEGDYHGYKVKAISHGEFYSEFNIDGVNEFYNISLDYDHVIYNMPELSAGLMRLDALSICHGIWFDHNNYGPMCKYRQDKWFNYLYKAFENPHRIVSVDTNSINVIRSLWPNIASKMKFIPNFVDHTQFFPPKQARKNERLKILFPRRSQINRGSRILGDIIANVHHDVDFYWVGEGDDYDTQLILNLCKQDSRLHYEKASFDEMPEWYRMADIVVIPTIACEGTSLSCIEALASGCATISTNVGGLTDIIFDGINGLSVDPEPHQLAEAINALIESDELREKYQKSGLESSLTFSLDNWKQKWQKVLYDEKWLESKPKNNPSNHIKEENKKKIVIITKNAYHGGVESLIKLESERLSAQVIVAGGLNNPDSTCPFPFTYVSTYEELRENLKQFDVVIYHWPIDWAVQAIKDSGLPSLEFVHREDTSECDKSVPTLVATHSIYIKEFMKKEYGIDSVIIPNVVDTDRFKPSGKVKQNIIGATTSYFKTKGIDIFIEAWAIIAEKYKDYKVKFYGNGSELGKFREKANSLGLSIEFNNAVADPTTVYDELKVYVTAARIEGLPIAVLESLSSNVPVIASNIEGHAIINKMAKEHGLEEPIILFESENSRDLAEKIDRFLSNYEVKNVRSVIEEVFSPQRHIEGLREGINKIYDRKKSQSNLKLVEECKNTLLYAQSTNDEGFFAASILPNGSVVHKFKGDILEANYGISSYKDFLCYRYHLKENTSRVSCMINCEVDDRANVFIQYNWCDENGSIVKMIGSGRYIDKMNTKLYAIYEVPTAENASIKYLDIIIRPNPDQYIKVNDIYIRAWE